MNIITVKTSKPMKAKASNKVAILAVSVVLPAHQCSQRQKHKRQREQGIYATKTGENCA